MTTKRWIKEVKCDHCPETAIAINMDTGETFCPDAMEDFVCSDCTRSYPMHDLDCPAFADPSMQGEMMRVRLQYLEARSTELAVLKGE